MYYIFEKLSKRWVTKVGQEYVLTDGKESATKFNVDLSAYTIIGRYFGDRQFDCEVYKVEVNDV